MFTKDDVAKVLEDLGNHKIDPPVVVGEPKDFGLSVDLHDPVSGHILTVARPHRPDIGQTEILHTAERIAAEIATLRIGKMHADRAAGITAIDPSEIVAAKDAAAKTSADEAAKAKAAAAAAPGDVKLAQAAADAQARADRAAAEAKNAHANADAAAAKKAQAPQTVAA